MDQVRSVLHEQAAMAGQNPDPAELMLFYKHEREFFARLVRRLGQDPARIRWCMAIWLWLEFIGHYDFIPRIASYLDHVVLQFVSEAEAILDRLSGLFDPDRGDEIPYTDSLTEEPITLGFFGFFRDVAVFGVTHFFRKVCRVIFDDASMWEVATGGPAMPRGPFGEGTSQQGEVAGRAMPSGPFGEGTSQHGATVGPVTAPPLPRRPPSPVPVPPRSPALNPMARAWAPGADQSPEDQRSMFVTFSKGHPLTKEEITEFFTSRFGPCLEVVMIERVLEGQSPMYGRLVFTSTSAIVSVLNGEQTAKFMINGKHVWARMFVPRQN